MTNMSEQDTETMDDAPQTMEDMFRCPFCNEPMIGSGYVSYWNWARYDSFSCPNASRDSVRFVYDYGGRGYNIELVLGDIKVFAPYNEDELTCVVGGRTITLPDIIDLSDIETTHAHLLALIAYS